MNLTKEKFMFATDLISKRTDMLRGKEKSLYNLYDICNTTEQRELVRQLLLDFNEMTADVFNLCLIEMSKYILSFGYPLDECMVTAMAHDHMPDSSQGVLNSIKVPLELQGFPSKNYCNRANRCKKYTKGSNISHFFVVDDFVGSGTTIISRKKTFEREFQGIPYTLSFVIGAGMREAISSLKAQGVDIYCAYIMDKGISSQGTQIEINQKLSLMSDIESRLAVVINQTNLKDYHLGYKQTEALFCRKNENCPNNVFPLFWWKRDLKNNHRDTLFVRVQDGY